MTMTISTTIESDNGEWELSANYNEEKKRFYGVGLLVPKEVDNDSRYWDNPAYLYEELFPMIEKMHNREITIPVTELNTSIYRYLQYDKTNVDELYEVLNYGKQMGWQKIK